MAAIAAFGFANVNAQEGTTFGFGEGDIFIEGNVSVRSSKDKNTLNVETKTNSFTISPKAGYFLTDQFAVGAELGFGKYKEETGNTINEDVSTVGGGLFARYYFLELGKRFKTYSEFGIGYGTAKDKGNAGSTLTKNTFGAGLDLGINYFVTEKIALTFGLTDILSVSTTKNELTVSGTPGKTSSTNTDVNFGIGSVNNPFGGNATFGILFKL